MHRRQLVLGSAALALAALDRNLVIAQRTPEATPTADWARPDWFTTASDLIATHQHTVMVGTQEEYLAGRISMTDVIDWSEIDLKDSRPETIERWTEESINVVTGRGISQSGHTVIADYGTLYAPRLFWVLSYLGVTDLTILNGGFPAWQTATGQIDQGPVFIDYMAIPWDDSRNESVLVGIDEVIDRVQNGGAQFIDARTAKEFAAGHLPGAVNIPFLDNSIESSGGTFKVPADLRAMYDSAGIDPAKPIIPYCSTGVRSAATWFTLNALGYADVRLFSGSWREWSADPSRPVEVGTPVA